MGGSGQQAGHERAAGRLSPRQATLLGAAAIAVLTWLVYAPAMRAGYIWDDDLLLTNNPMVRMTDGWWRVWFNRHAPDFFPLTTFSFWLEYRLWGEHAAGYHCTNVLLHTLNGVLIWVMLRRLECPAAWLAAGVFALHPVNVASVAWIAERKNTLALFFYLLSIIAYLRFEDGGLRRWHVMSVGLFVLALLAKTSVVMLPAVLLLLAWWRRGRVTWVDVRRGALFWVAAVVLGTVTVVFQLRQGPGVSAAVGLARIPLGLAIGGRAIAFYLLKIVMPVNVCMIYPRWPIDLHWPPTYVPAALVAAAFAMSIRHRHRWGRPILMGLGYFVITMLPLLGFVSTSYMERFSYVADHWQYVAIIGPVALAVGVLGLRWQRLAAAWRPAGWVAAAVVIGLLGAQTRRQAAVFADSETLWRHTLSLNDRAWAAHNGYGVALAARGDFDRAIRHYRRALEILPEAAPVYHNLGTALAALGRTDEAIAAYRTCVEMAGNNALPRIDLGVLLARRGELPEAMSLFSAATCIEPHNLAARTNLAFALAALGRPADAVVEYRRVLTQQPDAVEAANNLSWLLATHPAVRDPPEAVRLAERACRLTGYGDTTVLDTMAIAYAAAGQFDRAEQVAEQVRAAGDEALAAELGRRIDSLRGGGAEASGR